MPAVCQTPPPPPLLTLAISAVTPKHREPRAGARERTARAEVRFEIQPRLRPRANNQPTMSTPIYELSTDHARMQIEVIHGFLSKSYWSPGIRREVVEAGIRHSVVIGAFDCSSAAQIGFARAITDFGSFAYLCDVFVIDGHGGQGLAREMVAALIADPRIQTVRHWTLATRDAHGVYEPFGFNHVEAGRWLRLACPVSNWQEPGYSKPDAPAPG